MTNYHHNPNAHPAPTVWRHKHYLAPVEFLIDQPIREYDISKANISVLTDAGVLTQDQYEYFLKCPKIEREIAIGKMQGRDPKITEILSSGIEQARRIFMEINQISDNEVLSIRNDSITVVRRAPITNLKISDRVSFRLESQSTSFYRLNKIDYFYYYNRVSGEERLNTKGLGETSVPLHEHFMLDFLMELFYQAQVEGVQNAISILQNFYRQYVSRELPTGYYRELNSQSRFRVANQLCIMNRYIYMDYASEAEKPFIDISFNEELLRHLNRILASVYFSTR